MIDLFLTFSFRNTSSPCGIVLDIKELYNSESKSQVYGHLHDLLDEWEHSPGTKTSF